MDEGRFEREALFQACAGLLREMHALGIIDGERYEQAVARTRGVCDPIFPVPDPQNVVDKSVPQSDV